MTASFLPKPVTGINGSGMHTNLSVTRQSKNLFFAKDGKDGLADAGWDFIHRILAVSPFRDTARNLRRILTGRTPTCDAARSTSPRA